jgi:hypothetical protein
MMGKFCPEPALTFHPGPNDQAADCMVKAPARDADQQIDHETGFDETFEHRISPPSN